MGDDSRLLDEQQEFYRRRAPEYDEWWQRRGPYDRGPDDAERWSSEVAEVEAAVDAVATGNVLELAGGTGWWTQRLARTADRLTVVDGCSETLELNRRRVERNDVEYVVADLVTWQPATAQAYDLVFFSFWLSHVPRARFAPFWDLVARCLAPGGHASFIDNRRDPTVTSPDPYVLAVDADVQLRRLSDGSTHRVVKVFYEPVELVALLHDVGWDAEAWLTPSQFIYGRAQPALQ